MKLNNFLAIFIITFIFYFTLDFFLNNAMFYIFGGVIGGLISEAFKAIGLDAGVFLIELVWMVLLMGTIVLFYRLNSNNLKYFIIILIAILLYGIDMLIANIPYSCMANPENITLINKIIVGLLVLTKSTILSLVIYTGIK